MDRFQILSLSGGGYKGLYTALLLAAFEEHYSTSIYKHFDLIAGTSIGGIIALGLAQGVSARQIANQLLESGNKIFKPLDSPGFHEFKEKAARRMTGSEFGYDRGIKFSKHSNEALSKSIVAVLGSSKMSDLKTRTMIPAVNLSNGRAQFFKTQHNKRYIVDAQRSLVDVALATSAAPLYLPMNAFDDQIFVDGGLVGNNPGLFALSEAEENIDGVVDDLDIHMLSIGALSQSFSMPSNTSVNIGVVGWAKNLVPLIMSSQENMTTSLLSMRMKDHFYHIDGDLTPSQAKEVALDKATEESSNIISSVADNSVREHTRKPFLVECFAHSAIRPVFFNQSNQTNEEFQKS